MFDKISIKLREWLPKKRKHARIIRIVLCFLVAAGVAVAIYMTQQSQNTIVTVVKTNAKITDGTWIRTSNLTLAKVGGYGLPDSVFTSMDEVAGHYAAVDIYPEDYITPEKLTEQQTEPFSRKPEGKNYMSFTALNLSASVAGNIRPGDIIQVIYGKDAGRFPVATDPLNGEGSTETEVIMPEALKRLKVVDIKDAEGFTRDDAEKEKANPGLVAAGAFIPSVITVLLDEQQAVELYKAELSKSAYAILVERGEL